MKKKLIRNSIMVGTLSIALISPSLLQTANASFLSHDDMKTLPIRHELGHWSENYIDQLTKNYDVGYIFENKNLDDFITEEDFHMIIKITMDEEYKAKPDALTREAIVHELTKIWAERTDKTLETIPVIKMIIYTDTNEIDKRYNHSVTVAYMKDIAKGRAARVFDPKGYVTYGELAALIANTEKAIENELTSNSVPIMKGRFETLGSYEVRDDKVVFDFGLMSHYTELKEIMFGSGQQFEVIITNDEGEEVYRYSDHKFFTQALVYKSIEPGESMKWQDEWDMTNKEGEKLTSGKYRAEIEIIAIIEDNDEKVSESELTTVIDFELMDLSQEKMRSPVRKLY